MVTLQEDVGDLLEGGCILWNVTVTKTREQRRKDNYWMYDVPIVDFSHTETRSTARLGKGP